MLPVTYSVYNADVDVTEQSRRSRSRRFVGKPSWLLLSISDMEDKIEAIEEENNPDTFAERAEFYYRRRPQLLALLQDFYNRYLYLADRYTRTLSKHHQHQAEEEKHVLNDVESSSSSSHELVMAELVMKFVEYEIVVDELETAHTVQEESKKKMELQKSLLEVLESERVVLTNENSRLASECLFMKRKAGELARCVLLGRHEDHRVFLLGRKIDDLQGQIYELEKRNKEYYNKLTKQEQKSNNTGVNIKIKKLVMKNNSNNSGSSLSWSGGEEDTSSTSYSSSTGTNLSQIMKDPKPHSRGVGIGGKKSVGWWDRVKKLDMFVCGPHFDATCC